MELIFIKKNFFSVDKTRSDCELKCYTYVLSVDNEVKKSKFLVSCPEDFVCYREGKSKTKSRTKRGLNNAFYKSWQPIWADLHWIRLGIPILTWYSCSMGAWHHFYYLKEANKPSTLSNSMFSRPRMSAVFPSHHCASFISLLESGKGGVNLGCGPKNLTLDNFSYGETLSNGHMLSATAFQFHRQ